MATPQSRSNVAVVVFFVLFRSAPRNCFAIPSLQVARDMESVAFGPLSVKAKNRSLHNP